MVILSCVILQIVDFIFAALQAAFRYCFMKFAGVKHEICTTGRISNQEAVEDVGPKSRERGDVLKLTSS